MEMYTLGVWHLATNSLELKLERYILHFYVLFESIIWGYKYQCFEFWTINITVPGTAISNLRYKQVSILTTYDSKSKNFP